MIRLVALLVLEPLFQERDGDDDDEREQRRVVLDRVLEQSAIRSDN